MPVQEKHSVKKLCEQMLIKMERLPQVRLIQFKNKKENLSLPIKIEEWLDYHANLANELRKPDTNPEILEQLSERINTTFNMLDLNHDGYIAKDEWIKTCQFFGVDEKTAEKSFEQITKDDKLEEDKAKQLFFEYLKSDDPNHISNCCLCFL